MIRCIAMVMIWNQLAKGNNDFCAILVVINAILQVILFSPFTLLFVNVISKEADISVSYGSVALSVLIVSNAFSGPPGRLIHPVQYLGIPLIAGVVTRYSIMRALGRHRFETNFLRYFSPLALLGLLYTIVVMFAYQGHHIIHNIGPVFRVFVPLILYFVIMWSTSLAFLFFLNLRRPNDAYLGYEMAVTQSFTASSNNFVSMKIPWSSDADSSLCRS